MKKAVAVLMVVFVTAFFAIAKENKPKASADDAPKVAAAQAEKTIDLGNEVSLTLVLVPAGEFDMGSPMSELKRDDDEAQHHIKLTKPFYMGKFEVTQLQFRVIMEQNPSKFGGDKLPVDNINWYEACRFLKKLSEKTGVKFRLPTEAEWEYACRAGTTTAFNTGTTIDSDLANYEAEEVYADGITGTSLDSTCEVGKFKPNAFGLYDMHGNVWEWCSDYYDENYYKVTPLSDPKGPQKGDGKVLRGGAWNEPPAKCRSADRNHRGEKANQPVIGFRVVMDVE